MNFKRRRMMRIQFFRCQSIYFTIVQSTVTCTYKYIHTNSMYCITQITRLLTSFSANQHTVLRFQICVCQQDRIHIRTHAHNCVSLLRCCFFGFNCIRAAHHARTHPYDSQNCIYLLFAYGLRRFYCYCYLFLLCSFLYTDSRNPFSESCYFWRVCLCMFCVRCSIQIVQQNMSSYSVIRTIFGRFILSYALNRSL